MKGFVVLSSVLVLAGLLALGTTGCSLQTGPGNPGAHGSPGSTVSATAAATNQQVAMGGAASDEVAALEIVSFTLHTAVTNGKIVFVGVGGEIDGIVNPNLEVKSGTRLEVTLINGDGMQHDIALPDFAANSSPVRWLGDQTVLTLVVDDDQAGIFPYYCTFPGHRQAGQEGRLVVREKALAASNRASLARSLR